VDGYASVLLVGGYWALTRRVPQAAGAPHGVREG
jgi:hypothetical protein